MFENLQNVSSKRKLKIKVVSGGPNDPLLILEIECAAEIKYITLVP